ncbi:hypothetical protein ABT010_39590 [Streptomyces sp. NPDC002668]|uniref:hypothetical protein n=1 Tax=Streptomyces sp. NPDC002668 TaxID=3154422 RepID=UPI00331CC0B9
MPQAVKRGGAAFVGTAPLALTVLQAPRPFPVVVVLLVAVNAAVAAGALDRADGASLPACLWHAAVACASTAAIGFGFLALYGLG